MAAVRVTSPNMSNGIDVDYSRNMSPSPTFGSPFGSPTAATLPRARSRTPNSRRSPTKCSCCPYGYHIDLDFVRFCDALAAAAAGRSPGAAAEKARRRQRRRQRQSMEVLLGVVTPDMWNIDTHLPQSTSEPVSTPSPRASVLVRDALSRAVKDFEDMLQKTTPASITTIPLEPPPPCRRFDGRSSFATPPSTPDATVISQNRSPVSSPPPPPPRTNGTAQSDSCNFLPKDGAVSDLSATALQNVREQVAKSLERTRELEEQVKVIPVLQDRISVLKEEKRKMLLELRGSQHKINNLNNNINTIQDGENKEILRIDENDLKVRKNCCSFEKKEPVRTAVQSPRPTKDASVGATINTRDVGVSPPRNRVRTVSTMTTKSPERTPEPDKPSPLIDNTSVMTDLLMNQIYTEADLKQRIDEALRSYETKLLRSKATVGVQVTIKDDPPKPPVRVDRVVQVTIKDDPPKPPVCVDRVVQTETVEKRLVDVAVSARTRVVDVGVSAVPRTRETGVSDCTVDHIDCDKCQVKRRSVGVGSGSVKEDVEVTSLSLSSLGVPRSKSFELPESPVKPMTRSFGCGTSDRYTMMLSRATNTDAPVPVIRKDVGITTVKSKLVNVGVEADLIQTPVQSVHTCDKCSAVIKGVARDVLSRSRETVASEAQPELSATQSRIPRFTGSSGMSSTQTSPCPSMTSSLTMPSSGSSQRKFMRQDTYTKIPSSASSKTSPDRGSASQRKSSSSLTKETVPTTTNRPEWSDSEDSARDVSRAETPERASQVNQLFKPIQNEKRVKSEPTKEMRAAMKVLHDSLEKNQGAQQGAVPPHLRSAYNVVQQEWFKVSSTKTANPFEVEDYLDHFEERSPKLLEYIVNITDNSGNTAMHYAVSHGNFDVVSILLDSKVCHVDVCNAAGYTSVMLVSLAEIRSEAHKHVVKRLLKLADVNSRGKQHGQTALMLAVSHGRFDTVRLLLEAGADINIQDEDGSTALMCAAEHGHLEIVKLLLSQPDCDVTIVDFDGSTALTIAMEADHRDIGVLLYAQQHFSRGSSPYASLKAKRSKSVTPTMRSSATPPLSRRTPTTPTSPLPSHKLKFNQSL